MGSMHEKLIELSLEQGVATKETFLKDVTKSTLRPQKERKTKTSSN